jgi:hypothetical protein
VEHYIGELGRKNEERECLKTKSGNNRHKIFRPTSGGN